MLKFNPNIKNFSLLGVNKATKDQDRVKTEIVNNLCLIAMIGWVFNNLVINFLDGKYFDILVAVPLFISFFLPLYLNKVNKTHLSRLVLILSVSISLGSMYIAVGPRNYYEFLFILLFILILYLIDERRAQVILAFFVFLTWAIPYVYTKNYEPILGYSQKSGVVEVVFLCSMIAIYLISKKTVDQINVFDLKQEKNILQQKKVLDLISFHNKELVKKGTELKLKNNEIELFFKLSSQYLQKPTKELIGLSQSLEASLQCEKTSLAQELISIINHSSERMNELIEAVFEYSIISKDSKKEPIDCNQIIDEICIDMHNTITNTNAKIVKNTLPVIKANRVEIRMLFQNLISNAIKYAKKDVDPIIKLSAINHDAHWKFQIKDNGIGIAKSHQSKVFNMFQKLHNNEEYSGSGIGLSHCKKIVNLMDGEIWMDSTPDVGTSVFFTYLKRQN